MKKADSSWWSNTKNFFNNLKTFKLSPEEKIQPQLPNSQFNLGGSLGAGVGLAGASNLRYMNSLKRRYPFSNNRTKNLPRSFNYKAPELN